MLAGLLCAGVVAGCASTVDGHGQLARHRSLPTGFPAPTGSAPSGFAAPSGSAPSGFPAPSDSASSQPPGPTDGFGPPSSPAVPTPATDCPHISYPYAQLAFDCITSGLEYVPSGAVWPLNLQKSVEPNWALSEGAGRWGAANGHTLKTIAEQVRTQMVDTGAYGPSPGVRTTSSKAAKIAGVDAWVLQTTFTIDAAYREQQKLTVQTEKSWIVALKVGAADVSLWYVTIPDDVKQLWGKVASIMGTITVI